MPSTKLAFGFCTLAVLISSCAPVPLARPTPIPTFTSAPTALPLTPTPAPVLLTATQLKNAEYVLPVSQHTVQLVDGHYEGGAGADYVLAQVLEPMAFGDLNGDGLEDAAVLLSENTGGTGRFVSLIAILNYAGQPQPAGSVFIDDRPMITNVAIENQLIRVEALVHGVNDPMCCPAFPVTATYQWRAGVLNLSYFTSQTPTGLTRAIQLGAAVPAIDASGKVLIAGTITIAPFENTLVYRLYDAAGNELAVGPLSVTATEMGGPGTFEVTIDVSALASGQVGRLAILDLSAADGSVLALASVELHRP